MRIPRERYAALYGPTVGDQVRLADTDLWIEVERDDCAGGDEAVFGGGKTIRESMHQGLTTRAEGAPDLVMLHEPSLGLAPEIVQSLLRTIRDLNRHGLTCLLVEQNVPLADGGKQIGLFP